MVNLLTPLLGTIARAVIRAWPTDAGLERLVRRAPAVLAPPDWRDLPLRGYPLNLRVNVRSYLGKWVYYRGIYEEAAIAFLAKLLRPGMTFVDVGANIGLYTVLAAKAVGRTGRVIAVEPQPRLCELCWENCNINGVRSMVSIVAAACGAREGFAELYQVSRTNDGQATLRLLEGERCFGDTIRVPVRTLGDLLAEHTVYSCDGMKIDVEGAEIDVLQGYDWPRIEAPTFIIFECIDMHLRRFGHTAHDLLFLLRDLGYDFACRWRGRWRRFQTVGEHRKFGASPDCIAIRRDRGGLGLLRP